jgi:hypothetical protein
MGAEKSSVRVYVHMTIPIYTAQVGDYVVKIQATQPVSSLHSHLLEPIVAAYIVRTKSIIRVKIITDHNM